MLKRAYSGERSIANRILPNFAVDRFTGNQIFSKSAGEVSEANPF